MVILVAMGEDGKPTAVKQFEPVTLRRSNIGTMP